MQCTDSHRIAPEGYPFIALSFILTGLSGLLFPLLVLPFLGLSIFVTAFFRNPSRVFPTDERFLVSPADGKVIFSQEVEEGRFLNRKMRKISIFMSPFNVYINRIPWTGNVKRVAYNKGKYFAAYAEKASLDNEQNALLIEDGEGRQFICIQIAGFLARRIVCYAQEGQAVKRGSIYGLIRFGSRMDVYFPLEMSPKVKIGDKVKGGESVLAEVVGQR